ncbi:hypothetical protein J4457_00855 [Candidatus Woesearchaeota archaeon]|nr:hypothetical protein [Candidatus Woesearchaeota archaeon]
MKLKQLDEILWTLEGLHTVETAAEALHLTKQSTLNLLSKLKKKGYVTTSGGGKQKRLYKISMKKQRPRDPGMFDIINKYSPMKIAPWYDHQVHGQYGPEEALIDAIQTQSFRVILASLRLFNHIKDWKKLYQLAKQKDCWQQVGALYDVARMFFRVMKMTGRYTTLKFKVWKQLTKLKKKNFPEIASKWHIFIPFNEKDLEAIQ